MNSEGVARRYAQALFAAVPPAEQARVDERLADAALVLGRDPLATVWRHPGISVREKRAVVHAIFGDEPWVERLARVLLQHRRETLLADTSRAYHTERLAAASRVAVTIRTARAVDAAWQERLTRSVAERVGQAVEALFVVDPEVLGGVEVQFRDQRLDGTVRGRLRRLRQSLKDEVMNS